MLPQANDHMTIDEQVAFYWRHRAHFAWIARHNLRVIAQRHSRKAGEIPMKYRNAWQELANYEEPA